MTVEVIEILPNGNLVVEGRTTIVTDQEESVMTLTGICRPQDISVSGNTILSNQLHDLTVRKMHRGELKNTASKGILAQILDFVIAF